MSAQSLLARLGLRAAIVGSAASLVYAAPIADGNVSNDAHTHTGRTGWFHPTATSMGFVTNGAERLRLWEDGGVQIGGAYGVSPGAGVLQASGFVIPPAALPGTPAVGVLAIDSGATNALKWWNGSAWQSAGGTATPPGGLTTQVQFNDGGAFGGSADFTFTKAIPDSYSGPVGATWSEGSFAGASYVSGSGLNALAGNSTRMVGVPYEGTPRRSVISTDGGATWANGGDIIAGWVSILVWTGTYFVAGCGANSGYGQFMYSADGVTWSASSGGGERWENWNKICVGRGAMVGTLVACGSYGYFAFSSDHGVSWTTIAPPANWNLEARVACTGTEFVMFYGGYTWYSTNGFTWTLRSSSGPNVAFSGGVDCNPATGRIIGVTNGTGVSNTLLTTIDGGLSWAYLTTSTGSNKNCIQYINGTWIIAGSAGFYHIWRSTDDGTSWSDISFVTSGSFSLIGNSPSHGITVCTQGGLGIYYASDGFVAGAQAYTTVLGKSVMHTSVLVPQAAPIAPVTGTLFVDSGATNALKWWNGSAWQSAGGTATPPGGSANQLQFNNAGVFGGIAGSVYNGSAGAGSFSTGLTLSQTVDSSYYSKGYSLTSLITETGGLPTVGVGITATSTTAGVGSMSGLVVTTSRSNKSDGSLRGITSTVSSAGTNSDVVYGLDAVVSTAVSGTGYAGSYALSGRVTVSGTQAAAYGLYLSTTVSSGTTTNVYGIYIDGTVTGIATNRYGIYQADPLAVNVFKGAVRFDGSTSGSTAIQAAAVAGGPFTWTLPVTAGAAGNVLRTNGAGVLSWVTAGGAPGGSTKQLQFNNLGVFGGIAGSVYNSAAGAGTFSTGLILSQTVDSSYYSKGYSLTSLITETGGLPTVGVDITATSTTTGVGNMSGLVVTTSRSNKSDGSLRGITSTVSSAGTNSDVVYGLDAVVSTAVSGTGYAGSYALSGRVTVSGTQAAAYGLYLSTTVSSGTTTNVYGIYIDGTVTGIATNRYGVYQADPLAVNFFAGQVQFGTAGFGLSIKEGSNAKQGLAVLVGGTVTVATTAVTANSRIYISGNVDGGAPGWVRVSAKVAGTSFTLTSSSVADTSSIAWLIVEAV